MNELIKLSSGYSIIINGNIIDISENIQKYSKICIVTNRKVWKLYGKKFLRTLNIEKYNIVFLLESEKNKNLDQVNRIYEKLLKNKFKRNDIILSIGGGIVGDIAGFAAATYNRGVCHVICATTLLAQVDSSIGGKTGVNYCGYKNIIGSFYDPKLVLINTKALETLDNKQYLNGLGEVLKYALIYDKGLFKILNENSSEVFKRDHQLLKNIIYRCCQIKADIVEKDKLENGIRMILNFGHTCGHAIEFSTNNKILHGEAVAEGMKLSSIISFNKGLLEEKEKNIILNFLYNYFPSKNIKFNWKDFVKALKIDKKRKNNDLTFITISKIGKVQIKNNIKILDIKKAVETLYENISY